MTLTAQAILDRHYLELRCGLLDLAAAFDRVERAQGAAQTLTDPRMQLLAEGVKIVASSGTDRAERLQLLLSDPYVANWNK